MQKENIAEEISEKVEALLSKMTLREKIGQLNQTGSTMICALPGIEADIDNWVTDMLEGRISSEEFDRRMEMCQENLKLDEIEAGEIGSFVNLYEDEKVAEVHRAAGKSRLQIPVFVGVDIIRGYRTIFPTPLAMSCGWDMGLFRDMAAVAKKEAKVSGVNWAFGPVLDIARDARWGRIVESPGEDPYLAADIAGTLVKAFQEEDENGRLLATAKHFAAYGAVSGGQDYNTVSMSKQMLYDTYLPPFRAAVNAKVGAVMSAFHDLNGIPCTCDHWLLTEVLREEMGFTGFVVSDAEGVKQCAVHGVAENEREAAKLSLLAGGDMDMSSLAYRNHLENLVETGEIEEEQINIAVRRVLKKKYEFGLFDEPYDFDKEKINQTVLCRDHREKAEKAAERTAVLLKNQGVLPISKDKKKILVIGALAEDKGALMGPWAFTGEKDSLVTIIEGMRQSAPEGTEVSYCRGFDVTEDRSGFKEAWEAAKKADFVVAVAGETAFMSGEAASRASLRLAGAQEEFLLELAKLQVPAAVVLVNGRPLAIGALENSHGIGAILETWHLGCESGTAVARLLFGVSNPSGKLTVTFANEAGQEPMYYDHPNTGKPGGTFKFTSKYQDVPIHPLYPFGFGLSYTEFSYENLQIQTPVLHPDGELQCTVTIKNTGAYFGEEVVQLYIRDEKASCVRPVRELKGYQKIGLYPYEEKTCTFRVPVQNMGFYDRECRYVVEPGIFTVFVGPDSTKGLSGGIPGIGNIEEEEDNMYHAIRPGQVWLDTEGKRIQAHGGSIITVEDTFYWYGENKEKTTGKDDIWHWGVRCYSSGDLYNWKDEGIIIPPDTENPDSPLNPRAMMDRPHIVFNENTGKYVAWLKIMGEPPCFAVLSADHILGPYQMVNPRVNPCGLSVGDFDLAVAPEDNKAYLFSERPHTMLYCADLNEAYTDAAGMYTEHFPHTAPPAAREAPAHFMRKGLHYLITSGTTGYHPNPSEAAVSRLWHGPYEILGNPHAGDASLTSYNSQISSVFRHPGKKDLYIALADRWLPELPKTEGDGYWTGEAYKKTHKKFKKIFDPESNFVFSPEDASEMFINSSLSDYVWLPLRFEGDRVYIDWREEWTVEEYE